MSEAGEDEDLWLDEGENGDHMLLPKKNLLREVSGTQSNSTARKQPLHKLLSKSNLRRGSEEKFFKLLFACNIGDADIVKRQLSQMSVSEAAQRNPKPDAQSHGLSPIHVAKNVEIIKLLVDFGFPLEFEGEYGQHALHSHHSHPDIVEFLISRGADIDSRTRTNGSTPLQWAVAADSVTVVKVLVKHGADVSYQNVNGNTALHMVLSLDVARALVQAGALVNVVNENGNLPVEEAASRAFDDSHYEVAIYLLEASRKSTFNGEVNSPVLQLRGYQNSAFITEPSGSTTAKQKWDIAKNAFLRQRSALEEEGFKGEVFNSRSSDRFYNAFFELMVRERPGLALKVLDRQRTFLYWENASQVYNYDTSLLGTASTSSHALKHMVLMGNTSLISHPVVQYSLSMRWILFTREVLWWEFSIHLLFVGLMMASSFSDTEFTDLSVFLTWQHDIGSYQYQRSLVHVVLEMLIMMVNLRYIRIQVVQSQITDAMLGRSFRWTGVMHSKLRNEQFYLLPHICLLVAQVLRCFPSANSFYIAADILIALTSWRFFYRSLAFGEGFETLGVAMSMIRSMIGENGVYFMILITLVTAFSHSMYVLFRGAAPTPNEMYGNFGMTWITLFFFAFNLDLSDVYSEKVEWRKYFGFVVLAGYMFLTVNVCLNLIVAVMTNTYEKIKTDSHGQWLLQRARIILFFEYFELALHSTDGFQVDSKRYENLPTDTSFLVYPPGPFKHFVKETKASSSHKYVMIEVKKFFIDDCVLCRSQRSGSSKKLRLFCFTFWKKKIARSDSFLWPDSNNDSIPKSSVLDPDLEQHASDLLPAIRSLADDSNSQVIGGFFIQSTATQNDISLVDLLSNQKKILETLEAMQRKMDQLESNTKKSVGMHTKN